MRGCSKDVGELWGGAAKYREKGLGEKTADCCDINKNTAKQT